MYTIDAYIKETNKKTKSASRYIYETISNIMIYNENEICKILSSNPIKGNVLFTVQNITSFY